MINKSLPVLFIKKENCCGCSACYAICSVHAITMLPDEEGFLYPAVDEGQCIRCYRCLSVCVFKSDQAAKGFYNFENGDID
ncbi:MAG: 4Fe-4S dicluster domain-containing protein [Butyrivibrio sp.]|nr:4Fe-4S dicluster domain-containing protein [Butyrivibrio sp.]